MDCEKLGSEYKNFTVSEGTLVLEDIVDKISLLVSAGELSCQQLDTYIDEFFVELASDVPDEDNLNYIYDDIFETMSEIAPEGCVFGGHEGDPACIGWWEVDEPYGSSWKEVQE